MATQWTELIDGEVLDCSSISINYAPTGLATISFTVYRPVENGTPYCRTASGGFELTIGGTYFKGVVTEMSLNPASDVEFNEWKVAALAVGYKV